MDYLGIANFGKLGTEKSVSQAGKQLMSLLDKSRIEIKLGDYGTAPATALADVSLHPRVQDYRRQTGGRMYPLDKEDINRKIPTAEFYVSRKIDGEFTVMLFREGETLTVNPGGTVRVGMPWQEEATNLLKAANVEEAIVVGELYVKRPDGKRGRVHDVTSVARGPESKEELEQLQFAVFDVIPNKEGEDFPPYADTWKNIESWFGKGQKIHPVETEIVKDQSGITKLFDDWVIDQGAEGVVARSDSAGFFKIKPRHTLDAVVIGFTESTEERTGMLHDILCAVRRHDGTFHVLTKVGGGFSEEQRRDMLSDLKDMVVESEYVEVNSDHVAYQMVEPKWVVEISCLDMISQTTRGGPVNRMVLDFDADDTTFRIVRRLPLAAVISPQYIRHRDDKQPLHEDVRIEQVANRVEVPHFDRDARSMTLPKSEVIRPRSVYKGSKGQNDGPKVRFVEDQQGIFK